ncbi:MAG: hypothetical protein XD78_1988 [Desulfotomaculum sp. 46_296]|nr:MAG: hypothetical protein XD78_1988 [Desulfotomaculum sp. 46_296]HAU31630.1 hypothetical protein [Desulfotomaculum sp.]
MRTILGRFTIKKLGLIVMSLFILSLLATFINGSVLIAGANEPYENTNDKLAIKDVITKFCDTKYQSLSVLQEKDISIFWKTDDNPGYKLEAASLSIDVNHRKIQPLDLRFEKYVLKMDFEIIDVFNDKAEVKVVENSQIYQNASPDVCSELRDEHIIKLEKINDKWLIISDNSNDETKKDLLLRIATGKTINEAKKEILENSKHEVMTYNQQKMNKSNKRYNDQDVGPLTVNPMSLQGYNRDSAVQYALDWAYGRNPSWGNYTGQGGDCTNFTSQCLYAGGIPFDTVGNPNYNQRWFWYSYSNTTPPWTGVNPFWDYALHDTGYGLHAGTTDVWNAIRGDIAQLYSGSSGFHSLFINNAYTDGQGNRHIFICCHDTDRRNYEISNYTSSKRYLKIYGWYN